MCHRQDWYTCAASMLWQTYMPRVSCASLISQILNVSFILGFASGLKKMLNDSALVWSTKNINKTVENKDFFREQPPNTQCSMKARVLASQTSPHPFGCPFPVMDTQIKLESVQEGIHYHAYATWLSAKI